MLRPDRVAARVATEAAPGVNVAAPGGLKHRTNEPKRSLAARPERTAIAVRDREAPGSNPGPPTIFVFKIGDFPVSLESAAHSWITISYGAMKPRRCNGAFREAM